MSAFVIRARIPGLFVMSPSIFGRVSASLSSVRTAPARRRSQNCLPACTTQRKDAFFWTMLTCANMTSARCGRPSVLFFKTSCGTISASRKILECGEIEKVRSYLDQNETQAATMKQDEEGSGRGQRACSVFDCCGC